MELRITGEAAQALVNNINTYVKDVDVFDEDGEEKMLGLLIAIEWMLDDLLAQAGLDNRERTELELLLREKNEFYVKLTND